MKPPVPPSKKLMPSGNLEVSKFSEVEIVGVDLDYETVGSNSSMLMVTASGTAVTIETI